MWTYLKKKAPNTIQILWVVKNIAGQVLTYSSKNFYRLNKNLEIERTMNKLGKQFRKNQIEQIEKIVKIKVKMPHVVKKYKRESEFLFKQPFHNLL